MSTHPIAFPLPQAASTPAINPSRGPTPVTSSTALSSMMTPIQEEEETVDHRQIRQRVIELSSVSSMGEDETILMMPKIRDRITEKICLVGENIETLFANWRAERNLSANCR